MIKLLVIISFFLSINHLYGQTYLRSMDIGSTIQVTIVYDENIENSPNLDIIFYDGFEFFSIRQEYSGDYSWCIRVDESTAVAALKFEVIRETEELIISIKIDPSLDKLDNKEKIRKHLDMLFGNYSPKVD